MAFETLVWPKALIAALAVALAAPAVLAEVGAPDTDPVTARGKLLFETVGDVGCSACHGNDASGEIGPNIQGIDIGKIHVALTNVTDMNFITGLTEDDVKAIGAYLLFLNQH
ncbi:MAG: cytochrome c [Rhodobacteraceae bacterium]|nr:cytochrome c [Paracoccaceae bacterium]